MGTTSGYGCGCDAPPRAATIGESHGARVIGRTQRLALSYDRTELRLRRKTSGQPARRARICHVGPAVPVPERLRLGTPHFRNGFLHGRSPRSGPLHLPVMTDEPETPPRISVLVVDDSAFMRTALARMISSDPDLQVLGTACDGSEALERIATLDPDVVTLDVEMPRLGGMDTLRRIMGESPRPVIMVSATKANDAAITFQAMGAGAFDYVAKQLSTQSLDISHIRAELISKIKAAAQSARSRSALGVPRK